jgi:Cell wall-active antibiotics response 4TMS YvqF
MVSIVDGIFWGALLIILGVWFIVRRSVPVHIPVIRIIVAVLFVYAGVRILARGPVSADRNTAVFSESTMSYSPERGREYNLIFSSGSVDLSQAAPSGASIHAEVNVIFGSGTLRINPSLPVRVSMSSAFGSVESPNGRSVAFGEMVYTTTSYREGAPALEIHATAVFGRLAILQ